MKITYFTIEKIDSGLFRTQILGKLKSIISLESKINYEVIVFNSPFDYFKNRKIIDQYNKDNWGRIYIKHYPILPPLRYSLKNIFFTELILIWLMILTKLFVKVNSQIIHCRSYWPTILATRVFKIPVLFDLRSLFPAENVAAGRLMLNSTVYNYWLQLESKCFEKAKVCTVVSNSMGQYIQNQRKSAIVDLNPIVVDTEKIKFNTNERNTVRNQLKVENKLVFIYSGSLGLYGINIISLTKLIKLISDNFSNAFFIFLSGEKKHLIESILIESGIQHDRFFITESNNNDLSKWLSAADFGIHALPEQLDSSTRLGTKVVEYWAAGLPSIVNPYVGAAAQIIQELQIGYVLDLKDELSSEDKQSILGLLDLDRNKIRDCAIELFDSKVVAQKYINSYIKCLN